MLYRWHGTKSLLFPTYLKCTPEELVHGYMFAVPDNGHSLYWYSFDYGGIHVVQMSSEHNWTRGSEQYEWIKRDLEAVDRDQTPWVILTAHRMMVGNVQTDAAIFNVPKVLTYVFLRCHCSIRPNSGWTVTFGSPSIFERKWRTCCVPTTST